ncbi:DUF2800 domain-containing protein [Bacillus aquiflavi]|nr:DUF2800 domain-containing protein [Bacillus aquiflavi]
MKQKESKENRLSEYLVPIISKDELDCVAERFLKKYYPVALEKPMKVPARRIAKIMGLKVAQVHITQLGTIFGQIYFSDSRIKFYDIETGTYKRAKVKRGTILIDPDVFFMRNIGSVNNTIIHECVHWDLHKKFFELEKLYNREARAISCQVREGARPEKNRTPLDWMEWQANALAPRILMPEKQTRVKIEELIAKYQKCNGKGNSYTIFEAVVEELSDFFEVSKVAAKIRMIDLGYKQAIGVYNYIDEQYVPGHSFDVVALKNNQTFSISAEDVLYEYATKPAFKKILDSGDYLYVNAHVCINDPKYVQRNSAGYATLTEYARNHIDECCLIFDVKAKPNARYGIEYYREAVLFRDAASGAHRWMVCTKSPRLEESMEEETSFYAEEGTLAHELAELKIAKEAGFISKQKYTSRIKRLCQDPLFNEEMEQATEVHKDFCMERFNEARAETKDAVMMLEQRLDFSPWVPDGFGTSDTTIITDKTLEIIDLKYGKGIAVSAIENPQMKLYALGAINQFGFLYDLETIVMTISQPRLDSISSFEMTVDDLLEWAEKEVIPKAELAFAGKGTYCVGDHCRFCKAKATCRARAEENMKLAYLDFQQPPLLTDEEVVEVLGSIDKLVSYAKDIQEFALSQAINENKHWPGMKLVEGRGSRKYMDENAVIEALTASGFDSDVIYKKSLNTITALEKQLGKKAFQELLGSHITKAPGKIKLVREEDKRPEIKASPEADFQ